MRSLDACAHAHYMRHHFHTERFTTEQSVCRACEITVKRSMKKHGNGEVYKLRKTFAVFHLDPLCCFLLEEELIG